MTQAHSPDDVMPALSLQPLNFSATDPGVGGWRPLLAQGVAADRAGIDRLVVSDHVGLWSSRHRRRGPRGRAISANQRMAARAAMAPAIEFARRAGPSSSPPAAPDEVPPVPQQARQPDSRGTTRISLACGLRRQPISPRLGNPAESEGAVVPKSRWRS